MNLHNINSGGKTQRALLARDASGIVRVIATDGSQIAFLCQEVSTDAEEIDLLNPDRDCPDHGLYLWEGTWRMEHETWESMGPPTELVFDGVVRPVELDELKTLLAMNPPEEIEGAPQS